MRKRHIFLSVVMPGKYQLLRTCQNHIHDKATAEKYLPMIGCVLKFSAGYRMSVAKPSTTGVHKIEVP